MKQLLLAVLLLSIASLALSQDQAESTVTKMGQKVPQFVASTLDGKTFDISQMKGKVVLINFFATWCGPCMAEMPKLEKDIWQQLKDEGLVVLAVGREHSTDELIKFNKEKGFSFSIAPDPKRAIYSLFATQYIPRNVVVGKNGTIVFQGMGYSPEEFAKMADVIKRQLKTPS